MAASVTAKDAQTRVAALQSQIAFHKRMIKKHRREAVEAARELEDFRIAQAESLGFEVVVQPAHSQEAQSKCPPPK